MSAYEVGKFYRVPCVFAKMQGVDAWWPVMGGLHEDAEHINFHNWHWHFDARFLSARWLRRLHPFDKNADAARRIPLMLRAGEHPHHMNKLDAPGVFQKDNHPRVELKRRKCQRQWNDSTIVDKAPWIGSLENAYAAERLANGHCPHRGADLSTMPVDRFGCVECPLHGLRWHVATGKLVRRADWRKAQIAAAPIDAPPARGAS